MICLKLFTLKLILKLEMSWITNVHVSPSMFGASQARRGVADYDFVVTIRFRGYYASEHVQPQDVWLSETSQPRKRSSRWHREETDSKILKRIKNKSLIS